MVSTDAMILSATINSVGVSDISILDITGAYMIADMYEGILIKSRGNMEEFITKTYLTLYTPYETMAPDRNMFVYKCTE